MRTSDQSQAAGPRPEAAVQNPLDASLQGGDFQDSLAKRIVQSERNSDGIIASVRGLFTRRKDRSEVARVIEEIENCPADDITVWRNPRSMHPPLIGRLGVDNAEQATWVSFTLPSLQVRGYFDNPEKPFEFEENSRTHHAFGGKRDNISHRKARDLSSEDEEAITTAIASRLSKLVQEHDKIAEQLQRDYKKLFGKLAKATAEDFVWRLGPAYRAHFAEIPSASSSVVANLGRFTVTKHEFSGGGCDFSIKDKKGEFGMPDEWQQWSLRHRVLKTMLYDEFERIIQVEGNGRSGLKRELI